MLRQDELNDHLREDPNDEIFDDMDLLLIDEELEPDETINKVSLQSVPKRSKNFGRSN